MTNEEYFNEFYTCDLRELRVVSDEQMEEMGVVPEEWDIVLQREYDGGTAFYYWQDGKLVEH